jgi:hypothetical protein
VPANAGLALMGYLLAGLAGFGAVNRGRGSGASWAPVFLPRGLEPVIFFEVQPQALRSREIDSPALKGEDFYNLAFRLNDANVPFACNLNDLDGGPDDFWGPVGGSHCFGPPLEPGESMMTSFNRPLALFG